MWQNPIDWEHVPNYRDYMPTIRIEMHHQIDFMLVPALFQVNVHFVGVNEYLDSRPNSIGLICDCRGHRHVDFLVRPDPVGQHNDLTKLISYILNGDEINLAELEYAIQHISENYYDELSGYIHMSIQEVQTCEAYLSKPAPESPVLFDVSSPLQARPEIFAHVPIDTTRVGYAFWHALCVKIAFLKSIRFTRTSRIWHAPFFRAKHGVGKGTTWHK